MIFIILNITNGLCRLANEVIKTQLPIKQDYKQSKKPSANFTLPHNSEYKLNKNLAVQVDRLLKKT